MFEIVLGQVSECSQNSGCVTRTQKNPRRKIAHSKDEKVGLKSQSAMEYLMTYGWAILIIAIVLLAFFALGVFNPYTFTPKASAGNCQILRPNSPGTSASEIGPCNNEIPQSVARLNGNGYILVPAYPVANLPAYTINIWVYTTTSSYDSFLLYGYANTAAMPGCPSYSVNANPIGMATWNQNYPGNWYKATSNVSIPGSSWNMITLALSNGGTGTGTVSVYLNGVSSNTIAAQEVVGGATPSPEFEIGGATTGCPGSPIGTFTGIHSKHPDLQHLPLTTRNNSALQGRYRWCAV